MEDIAGELGCSTGKVSRIETGIVRARPQDVEKLLHIYAIPTGQRQALLTLLDESRKREWWRSYIDVVPPVAAELFSLEAAATKIQMYSQVLVPGILQTEQYARAIIGSRKENPRVIERRIELRMRRQAVLAGQDAPACTFLLDAAVLHTRVGERLAVTRQLQKLLQLAAQPNITIRIVPSVVHSATGTSFTIFSFTQPEYGSVTFIEALTRNIYIYDLDEVAFYEETFADVEKVALSPDVSRRLLHEASTRDSR